MIFGTANCFTNLSSLVLLLTWVCRSGIKDHFVFQTVKPQLLRSLPVSHLQASHLLSYTYKLPESPDSSVADAADLGNPLPYISSF